MACHSMAGAGIRIIHRIVLGFLLMAQECIPETGRHTAINSSVNIPPHEHGEMICR